MKNLISPNTAVNFSKRVVLLFLILLAFTANAQVGIGTTDPDPSSILDIKSDKQGLLVPRMTTLDRMRIDAPANGLLVYDTDVKAFFHYDGTSFKWLEVNSVKKERKNYVLVKSEADLPAPVAGKILLLPNYLYEINGTVSITSSIDLNNAAVMGQDSFEDVLQFTGGTIFNGKGGTIKNLTLKGGTAFNITGDGAATNSSLIVQNVVIDGMTTKVGSISSLGLYFGNIIQYLNNTAGITYSNIGNLLLSNQGWFANNSGTYEIYTGSFGMVEKVSGFSTVNGSAIAMDFSANPTVGTGVILSHIFSGTNVINAVKKYTIGSYAGYNFTNTWTVDSPGVPREGDANAAGNMNLTAAAGSILGSTATKLAGTTSSSNLFRFEKIGNNRLKYTGTKKRYFQINASVSFQGTNTSTTTYILYIAKGSGTGAASVVGDARVYGWTNSTTVISSAPIVGTIELQKDDYIEIWAERVSGTANMNVLSLSLSVQ